ncbi:transposable element Tcb1 transposase [Trichonephila clavipes]|nr:transposable element Tcb1 transposase [Trichonephila clavipes]
MAVTDRSVTSRTLAQHIESVTHHSVSARTIRRRLQQSGLSTRRALLGLPLTQNHRRLRRQWCHERRIDEAHFWLNGYVNKQNCRIWSEANPQVYVETPLHAEKLTVLCALWAGGILL